MEIVKVNAIPGIAKPVEGVDYEVIAGSPFAGDFVRVRDGSREMFTVQSPDPATTTPAPRERGRATHISNVRARAADLHRRGKHVEALSLLSTLEK